MEYGRSGLPVHFARCNRMNEEQRSIKSAARIREMGRRKTDLSVELNDPRKQVKQATQESQQRKEEGIDAAELQKKLANMVKQRKMNKPNGKKKKNCVHNLRRLRFSRRNGSEVNQDEGRGQHRFSWQISKLVAR